MSDVVKQHYELVPLDRLTPHPANPRRGDIELLGELIDANGFYGAVIVQRSTGHVLAGNHRLLAARQQGMTELPVIWLDVDDARAERIMLADNRSADLAGYDLKALNDLLSGLDDFTGTGYSDADLQQVLVDLAAIPTEVTKNEAGYTVPAEPWKPEDEWRGMPEYTSENLRPKFQILVSFETPEALHAFGELIGAKLTEKTRSTWYPPRPVDHVKDLRIVADA